MKKLDVFLLIALLILFLQGNIACQSIEPPVSIEEISTPEYVSGEIIVRFKPEVFSEEGELISESIQALNIKYGLVSMERLFKGRPKGGLACTYKLRFPEEIDINRLAKEYEKDPSVVYAEPNYIVHIENKVPPEE